MKFENTLKNDTPGAAVTAGLGMIRDSSEFAP